MPIAVNLLNTFTYERLYLIHVFGELIKFSVEKMHYSGLSAFIFNKEGILKNSNACLK